VRQRLHGIEDLGGFGGVVAQDVAEDERGALARGQQLRGGDEGQGDGGASPAPAGPGRAASGSGEAMRGRRLPARSMSRHRLVAILYSQVRSEDRWPNSPRLHQADPRVSWSASSASGRDPRMR